jgi:predicted CopG family antitoxin
MTTTVQVRDETRKLLDRLKQQMGLRSYDEVIGRLVKARTSTPESLFGACKGSLRFVREKEDEHKL